MTMQRVIDILRTERECVERAGTATPDKACDRACADCDLVLDDKEVLEAYNMAIKALEQEPCEDEYIKVPKKALKYRTAGMVAYNVDWLKNHFDMERAIICGEQEPCEDAVSRKELLKIYEDRFWELQKLKHLKENKGAEDRQMGVNYCINILKELPPVTPQPKTEVLGKIRAEIMDFEEELFHRPDTDYADYAAVRHCVEIIDKYKAEGSDKE